MAPNIKKELKSKKTLIYIVPGVQYNDIVVKVMKQLSSGSVCYVTLNKTSDSLKEIFKSKKIKLDNIVFIDAISKTLKKTPSQAKGVYFVNSPGALTELSLVIDKFLKHKFDYLVLDSLTNLASYQKPNTVLKFLSNLVNKIKNSDTNAVIYALDIKEHEGLVKESCTIVDHTVMNKKK